MLAPAPTPVWQPDATLAQHTAMAQLLAHVATLRPEVHDYASLHRFSVQHWRAFWPLWLQRSGIFYTGSTAVVRQSDAMAPPQDSAPFFPQVSLNFAANLLRHAQGALAEQTAVMALSEARAPQQLSFAQLHAEVMRVRAGLVALGVQRGHCVAGYVPHIPEAVVAMLAATSLGAVWTACSPDFGVQAAADRLGQCQASVLVVVNGYRYGGKAFAMQEKNTALVAALPHAPTVLEVALERGLPCEGSGPQIGNAWHAFADLPTGPQVPAWQWPAFPFNQPLYILFSSGTTGLPKCIVHGAGGTLLQHSKELQLHCDLRPGDNLLYYTTCGWMMWNWQISALHAGATITLVDGSPAHPSPDALWQVLAAHKVSHFGTSARFLAQTRLHQGLPSAAQLPQLRMILSTGSPLAPEDFVACSKALPRVQLCSICGGTDIIGCFMLGNPLLPVYPGEIQAMGLGMDVCALGESAQAVLGEPGELCCRTPFVSMPVHFFGDADGSIYRRTYFAAFPGVWAHGDSITVTGSQGSCGGVVVHGRSDATLKPGGVRIGTAEIYRMVEALPEVADSVVVGQPLAGDVRVLLFVVLQGARGLDEALKQHIAQHIRRGASPRHVPAAIYAVDQIPTTHSGKKMELAVAQLVRGERVKNLGAMRDPHALDAFVALLPQLV